jgi:hypothetical protein
MHSRASTLFGLLLAATLTAPAALAQNATSGAGRTAEHRQTATERVEKRIADLREKLHISPAEEPLWDKFAQVMRDNAQRMSESARERAAKLKDMNASDNMQSYAQLAMVHAQDLQSLSAAFQPLYASFSPEQQRTADAIFREPSTARAARHRH